ncbi:MAG TPA: tetratricopeptide repeat protein [Candidatus Saccharimonadales bacterium]|jgi:TolA-binding protein|nr:tetratricopeptide repeat protein [Candidatus Saccharimonadales bacterium]
MKVRRAHFVFPFPRYILLWAIVVVLCATPVRAQKTGGGGGGGSVPRGGGGTGGGSRGTPGTGGPVYPYPPTQPGTYPDNSEIMFPTSEPFPKQPAVVNEDDACLPWDLSDVRNSSVSAIRLGVPGKARSEFQKACGAFKKIDLAKAEEHLRDAIDKYPEYPAAWVLLGQVMIGQQKISEAHDACSKPIKVDPTYLAPYLCLAGLLNNEKNWSELQAWTDRFRGLSLNGDLYASYYRGLALFHLHNYAEAEKSVSQAITLDSSHRQPNLFFLLAQIYGDEGNIPGASAQIQQFVKHAPNKQDKDLARQYLSDLQSRQNQSAQQ